MQLTLMPGRGGGHGGGIDAPREEYDLGDIGNQMQLNGFRDNRIGLFQGPSDEAAAEGRFVHVYVDNSGGAGARPVAPMPDPVRAAVVPLLRPQG